MKQKIIQKLAGVLLIVGSIYAASLDGDGTFALIAVPLGLFLLFTRHNVIE